MKQAEMMNNLEQTKAGLEKLLEHIKQSTNQEPLDEARRSIWRYSWPVPATVEPIDADGSEKSSEPIYVTIHYISAESVDFYSPRELEIDSKVVITLETKEGPLSIPATVLHSISSVGKPLVAVDFDLSMSHLR
ncbi:MAG: hypothetical protein GWP14_10780 [Actinobacteria bacterium]|nr:hypothetical protein [Actinomycetota bacterium]